MKDALHEFLEENLLSKENILKYIDDYSLFSYYINAELELNTKYSSPLRQGDSDPSFSIYYSKYKDKIMFKDQATGIYGDVFKFIGLLGNLTPREVLLQINKDFELGFLGDDIGDFKAKLVKAKPVRKNPVTIKITYREEPSQEYKDYWAMLDVSDATLALYYTTNPFIIHYIQEGSHITYYPKTLTISYEILGRYKIYHPYEDKKFKFRNNYKSNFVEGALQLKFHKDFAIITKSSKECIFMREHFDWEAVAGTSENTMIPEHFMNNILFKKYKKVFIWLDPDEAGIKAQDKYLQKYPWLIPIKVDDFIKHKDPTDMYTAAKKQGKQDLMLKYIEHLIKTKL